METEITRASRLYKDSRYGDSNKLNYSTLASAFNYDLYGNCIFNPLAATRPWVKEQTDAMQIGTIVDEHFTESQDFYSFYKAVAKRSGESEYEITNSMWKSIDTIISSINDTLYCWDRSTIEYFNMSKAQETLEDKELMIKGKLDFYNVEDNKIIDLKCPGNIDIFFRDLFYRGKLNIYHRYLRQLTWYSYLVEVNYGSYPEAELVAYDHKGNTVIVPIDAESRLLAWEILKEDIKKLRSTLDLGDYRLQVTSSYESNTVSDAMNSTMSEVSTDNIFDLL